MVSCHFVLLTLFHHMQVAVAARQWPTAQAALRTLLLDWEDDVPGLLLAAKVGIIAGKEHYRQAYDQAR